MKVIISGGGTGGHVYPAIAIADALKELQPEIEILFVGAEGKMEMEKVPQAGYPIKGLWISGIQRSLSPRNLLFPFKIAASLVAAFNIIRSFKPQVVIGVGGYASGPVMRIAQMLGIATLLQEQNSYAGLTNKWLAAKAKKICVAYPHMEAYFPANKIAFHGNPVRKDLLNLKSIREEAFAHFGLDSSKPTLLVLGGSLGALTINESVSGGLNRLSEKGIQLIWQTGKFYFDRFSKITEVANNSQVVVRAFINRMDYAYACADVVISRSGALSISELCLAKKPCILVPSPNVAEDHQTKNAMALVSENAAIKISDQEAREKLMQEAIGLLSDQKQKALLSKNIETLAKPLAAQHIAHEIMSLAL